MNEKMKRSHVLTHSILRNYQSALALVREAIMAFDDAQWRRGELPLQVPWKLAYHVVECLDYYFRTLSAVWQRRGLLAVKRATETTR